jgi:hypothetical protein
MAVANTVDYLKSITFSLLTLNEKCEVKKRGRPTPNLIIKQEGISHNKKYIRSFNTEWYNKISWLCGCDSRNTLFCFPCLLFGGDTIWTQSGFSNINKLKEKCEKHQLSLQHKNNVISLGFLGQVNITENLSEAYRLSKVKHNEQVQKNRNILSKLIDAIKFCGQYELPLRGHDESETSDNQGVFRGLLSYQAKVDPELREHLDSNSVFKGTSKTIQNELLQCILDVCHDHIAAEIKEATFLAVMADDTTDVSGQTQTVIVFRYLLHGTVYERYWGYFKPEDVTADGLSQCILTQLKTVLKNDDHKLIAQTYDGANVMSGARQSVQKKIQDVYKNAYYINCYAHQLNLIMKHVTSSIQSVRIFFMDISGIPTFFSQSPKRLEVLKKHMPASIPRPSNTRWNFNIRTVNSVFENKEQLINCFTEMVTFQKDKTFDKAKGYLALLKNETFLFWLQLFHKIVPHVEVLYNQMQSRNIDATIIQQAIKSFCNSIQMIRDSEVCMSASQSKVAESKEVCDRITMECRDRFAFTSHLIASKLFYYEHFPEYSKTLPEKEIGEACQTYSFIEKGKLKTELSLLYSRPEFHSFKGLVPLLQKLIHQNLLEVFQETAKLMEILITMPMTTAEPERCFSTLKRIKTYQRNSMNQERLLALSMLSIEKSMIAEIEDFNQKVIEKFCSKTRRMEFTLK